VVCFVPPLNRCKEVPAKLLCRRKEGASARVSEKVVLWDKSTERDGNVAIVKMGGVCSSEVLASALGRLIWFPMSVDLSPVVNVILYPWVSCEDESGGGRVQRYGSVAGLRALGTGSDRLRMAVIANSVPNLGLALKGFSVFLQLFCLLISEAGVLLEQLLDVGSDLLLFRVRDAERTDPPLDASIGMGTGVVLREPL
ncbi:unnamed protein product, partial [Symbiodinium sp. CCMP2456]